MVKVFSWWRKTRMSHPHHPLGSLKAGVRLDECRFHVRSYAHEESLCDVVIRCSTSLQSLKGLCSHVSHLVLVSMGIMPPCRVTEKGNRLWFYFWQTLSHWISSASFSDSLWDSCDESGWLSACIHYSQFYLDAAVQCQFTYISNLFIGTEYTESSSVPQERPMLLL